MARYIEYDTASGHIISILTASKPPAASLGISLMELDDDAEIEISRYVVKDGELKTKDDADAEKDAHSRAMLEYSDKVRLRVRNMMSELCLAQLKGDDDETERLRREYQGLRVYL